MNKINDKKMITEITNEQIDELLKYTPPYTEQNAANIKTLALEKINAKKRVFLQKYRRIIIAASLMLLLSIGVGAYYISNLFFVPLVGFIPDDNAVVLMYNAGEPVYIECDGKTFKLERAIKITSDNINFAYFEISTNDVNMIEGLFSYNITFFVKDNGEIKETRMTGGGASANYGNKVYERYEQGFVENLSDSDEIEVSINTSEFVKVKFDVTEDMLIYGSIAEINGIKLTAMMKKDDFSRIDIAYCSSNADAEKFRFYGHTFDLTVYAEDGSIIPFKGEHGWDNFYSADILNSSLSMSSIILDNPENKKISSIKTDCINASYSPKNTNDTTIVEIPIPADGETIETDIKYSFGGFEGVLMTKIERKGDTLFYETPEPEWYAKDTKERRNAVKKEEILATNQMFDLSVNNTWLEHRAMDKTISGITDGMEIVKLHLISIYVSYFGDWEIKFKY